MVTIWGVSNTTFNSVANHRTSSEIRYIDPEFLAQVVFDEVVVKITVDISNDPLGLSVKHSHKCHSRLDKSKSTIDIDFQNLCHVLAHVETYATWNSGRSTSVADISTDAERPDWNLKFVAQSHDGLYIGYIARGDNSRADKILFWCNMIHLEKAISIYILLGKDGVHTS